VPKITSKRCELVRLCHINSSGPVFLDTVYVVINVFKNRGLDTS